MKQRCEYCDSWIEDTDEVCPHCGAPNAHLMASGEGVPKTIEELKAFCERHHLPLKDMRFFIGEDYKEPRAFGIYQDGDDFVVYKNKDDGTRAVRYRGHDEAYAVNELYQKMKSEVANQKNRLASSKMKTAQKSERRGRMLGTAGIAALIFAIFLMLGALFSGNSRGYYVYDDTTYYYQDDGWYYYDTTGSSWERDNNPPTELTDHADDYYAGSSYDSSYGTSDFSDSDYYVEPSSDDSDWDDDDWDWDSSDSWDSGSTDWSSDW